MKYSIAFKVAHAKGREAVMNREYTEGEVQFMTVEADSRNMAEGKADEILQLRYVATSDDIDDYYPEILEVRELEGPVRDILTGRKVNLVHSFTTDEHGFEYEVREDGEQLVMTIRCPRSRWYRTKTEIPYADSRYVQECLDDYGLCELDREYLNDGTLKIYGF